MVSNHCEGTYWPAASASLPGASPVTLAPAPVAPAALGAASDHSAVLAAAVALAALGSGGSADAAAAALAAASAVLYGGSAAGVPTALGASTWAVGSTTSWASQAATGSCGASGGASSSSSAGVPAPSKPKAVNPPEKVFVGGLPSTTTNDELQGYFNSFGGVRFVELKFDGQGAFRGYGFVIFDDQATAERVVNHRKHVFQDKEIDCRRPLDLGGTADSGNDNKVFVGGLPKTCTKASVEAYFEKHFGRVASLQLKYNADETFRGFAFVTFEERTSAELACRTKGQHFEGKPIDCRSAVSEGPQDQLEKMFVGGLPKTAMPEQVEEHFSQYGKILSIDMKYHEEGKLAGKFRGFAFITFEDKAAAQVIYDNYDNNRFDGKWITCRPASKKPQVDDALDSAMKTSMNSPVSTAELLGIDKATAAARIAAYSAMMAMGQPASSAAGPQRYSPY